MRCGRSVVACVSVLLGFAAAAAACAASGSENTEHGPSFGADSGNDAPSIDAADAGDGHAEASSEASGDSPSDATGHDGSQEASADGGDAGDAADASDANVADAADSGCLGTAAIVAASTTSSAGATFSNGAWSKATAFGVGASAPPSLVSYGAGYIAAGIFNNVLGWASYSGSWTSPAQIAQATGQGTPALAALGKDAHLVYWGTDNKFYHGTYSSNQWDAANDPVGGSNAQSFGPSAPAAAAVGSALVVAQDGSDGFVYDQTWSGGSWGAANKHANASTQNTVPPSIVAMNGGSGDAMIVYTHASDYHLQYSIRSGGNWSAPADVYNQNGNVAFSNSAASLAALPGGRALVAWLGANAKPYYSAFDGSAWSAPDVIANVTVSSPPSVAAGVCGANALAAIVQSSGEVDALTWTSGHWSAPGAVAGATAMTYAAIASMP